MNQSDKRAVERMIESHVKKLQNSIVSQLTALNKAATKIDAKIDSREQIFTKELEKKSEMLSMDYNKQINGLISSFNKHTHSLAKSLDELQKDMDKTIESTVIELDSKIELIERVVNTNLAASQKHEEEQAQKLNQFESAIESAKKEREQHVASMKAQSANAKKIISAHGEGLRKITEALKKDISSLQASHKAHDTDISKLSTSISENKTAIADNSAELNRKNNALKSEVGLVQSIVKKNTKGLENLGTGLSDTKKHLDSHVTGTANAHADIKEKIAKAVASHKADMENMTGQVSALYGEAVEGMQKLAIDIENARKEAGGRSDAIHKELEHVRTTYASMDILTASMKKLHESVNTELIKANIALDRFRQECATNENMYRLRHELESQEKQQAQKVNSVLKELHSITSSEQKKLAGAIDKLNQVEDLAQKTSYGTDTRIEEFSEQLENRHAQLSEEVLAQNSKLYKHIDKGLTSLKRDLEKEMSTEQKEVVTGMAKLRSELFGATHARAEELAASISVSKAEMAKALATVRSALEKELSANKVAAENAGKKLSVKLETLDAAQQRFMQKSEADAVESWNRLVDAINDARDEAQKQVLSYTKNLQKKTDLDIAKFREKQAGLLSDEAKRNARRYAALEKEYREQSDRFSESHARLDKLLSEYRESNEADKKAFTGRIDAEIAGIKSEITQMHKFEDSLSVLNEERSQLMAMMDSFCQLKKDINQQEDQKLSGFSDYVREKANELQETLRISQKRPAKKKKHKGNKLPPKPKKTKRNEPRDIESQVQLLKSQGMSNEQIINVFRTEYGEYKVGKVKKFLRGK